MGDVNIDIESDNEITNAYFNVMDEFVFFFLKLILIQEKKLTQRVELIIYKKKSI